MKDLKLSKVTLDFEQLQGYASDSVSQKEQIAVLSTGHNSMASGSSHDSSSNGGGDNSSSSGDSS